jgi:hypothetical protein
MSYTSIYKNFTMAMGWICDTLELNLLGILEAEGWEALYGISNFFAGKTGGDTPWHARSIIQYGLAIKIKFTIFKLVSDPGNYYCRK